MGGDFGPRPCVTAVHHFSLQYPDIAIRLVGRREELSSLLPTPADINVEVVDTRDVVEMSDLPSHALRHKRQSSMWEALQLVASGDADACVSAGNTGALMAIGQYLLTLPPGIKRPAICKPIPTRKGSCYMLDLGANLECGPEHLLQFALMGAALARLGGPQRPRVALLNVGRESTKGREEIQRAAELIGELKDIDFRGFVEGSDLFSGDVDVIVCDGFVGNVALKVSEGLVDFMLESLNRYLRKTFGGRVTGWLAGTLIRRWSKKYNPALYNGAALLGLSKTVVKSHGSADDFAFFKALEAAREQVLKKVPEHIEESLRMQARTPPQ